MNLEEFRNYCLQKKGATESLPFDESTLVFKVMGKIFALMSMEGEFTVNLKCDPDLAIELREEYPAVLPGYHMSKVHWNTIIVNEVPTAKVLEWVDHSYSLVYNSLPKKLKAEWNQL